MRHQNEEKSNVAVKGETPTMKVKPNANSDSLRITNAAKENTLRLAIEVKSFGDNCVGEYFR